MLEKLIEIMQSFSQTEGLTVTEDTDLLADLNISSFDFVQIVCRIEEEFDVEIPDKQIKSMKTVGDVLRFLEAQ